MVGQISWPTLNLKRVDQEEEGFASMRARFLCLGKSLMRCACNTQVCRIVRWILLFFTVFSLIWTGSTNFVTLTTTICDRSFVLHDNFTDARSLCIPLGSLTTCRDAFTDILQFSCYWVSAELPCYPLAPPCGMRLLDMSCANLTSIITTRLWHKSRY